MSAADPRGTERQAKRGAVERLVVVGASLAGLRAVEAARAAGFTGSITLIGAERHLPYDRPPLSKGFLAEREDGVAPEPSTFRSEEVLTGELGVRLLLGTPASALDPGAGAVRVGASEVPYDALVIATGAQPRRLPGGGTLSGMHTLRTLDDAREVRAALDAGARTVVIGAGFIGSEIASSARGRGAEVTIVESQAVPLVRATGAAIGSALAALHERHGTVLRTGVGVRAVEGDQGRVQRVVLDDGSTLPAELVVVGIGVTPATDWLSGSGVPLDGERGGVLCDETLWTGIPGVWAAGDVVSWPNRALGVRQRLENWTAAAEQGAHAARNALDPGGATPYGSLPYYWSEWYGVWIQFVGTPEADEVTVVDGDPSAAGRWVALYRRGDRLVGALAVDGKVDLLKYRGLLANGASWDDALDFARQRRLAAAERVARSFQQAPAG